MAFSRYFVVLLPAVVPVLAVQIGAFELNRLGRGCCLVVLALLLASWWGHGFTELDGGVGGVREQDQFRLISQRTSGLQERYSPRARLFNLSDRMEVAMGRIPGPSAPWGGKSALRQRLQEKDQPNQLWLASSGPPLAMETSSNPCNRWLHRRVTAVNRKPPTSPMRSCCTADLKPWSVLSELSSCFSGAGQQQRTAGLRVHQ